MSTKFLKCPYIRVGINYFKIIMKTDRFGVKQIELKAWNKQEIIEDNGRPYIKEIPRYDDFIIDPNNASYRQKVDNCYNMYSKFAHKPKEGEFTWTKILLEHIFGEQIDQGLIYLQVLYLYPKQALPVLTLVSKERQTGKSTFIDWLNILFGNNMIIINPDEISHDFNSNYATKNIIAIEETLIEKSASVEKIKSLSTQKFISVNMKHVSQFKIPFFGKIIMASNNENKFLKVDSEEIRFFVRKLGTPKHSNHNILNDMVKEIPAFLHYLKQLPEPDFTRSRMVLTAEDIGNEALAVVKEHSRNWLYKELIELIEDWFNNEGKGLFVLSFSAIDVKKKWFEHDKNVSISWLKEVFLSDFGLVLSEKRARYTPFLGEMKTSKHFILAKNDYFSGDDENANSTDNQVDDENIPF